MAETKKKKQIEYPMSLPIGTILKGGMYPYRIEEVLGQGSYGITYKVLAQIPLGNFTQEVYLAVKENFVKKYCSRKADEVTMSYPSEFAEDVETDLQDFLTEGKRLIEVCKKSCNIVKVNETWRENGTAYYAMEYIDGDNLHDYVKSKGRLSEQEAIEILSPILDAVNVIHKHHLLHLDIKPENIMLRKHSGLEPILIDFGITLHFNQNGVITQTSKDHSIGCSDGYAPLEQYCGVSHFAPEVDVYALGATLYYMLVGEEPKKASVIKKIEQIGDSLPPELSERTKASILHAMMGMAEERTQTAKEFKNELLLNRKEAKVEQAVEDADNYDGNDIGDEEQITPTDSIIGNRKTYYVIGGVAIGIFVIALLSVLLKDSSAKNQTEETETIYVTSEEYCPPGDSCYVGNYTGYMYDGVPNGEGTIIYNNGTWEKREKFVGTFDNGMRSEGTLFYKQGNTYEGSFRNNEIYEGTYKVKEDNSYFKGEFKNDKPYNGTWYDKTGTKMSDVTDGKEKKNRRAANDKKEPLKKELVKREETKHYSNSDIEDSLAFASLISFSNSEVEDSLAALRANNTSNSSAPFERVELMPSFPGGNPALLAYLSSHVKYPVIAEENEIQGRVVVSFIVEKDGSLSNFKVEKSADPSLDKEALRVIRGMPKWIPGKQDGNVVRVHMTVPITFRLK